MGLCNIVEQAGCKVGGIGVAIEKSFLPGAEKIKKQGIDWNLWPGSNHWKMKE